MKSNRRWVWAVAVVVLVAVFIWDANRPKNAQLPTLVEIRAEQAAAFDALVDPLLGDVDRLLSDSSFSPEANSPTEVEECSIPAALGSVFGLSFTRTAMWTSQVDSQDKLLPRDELASLIVSREWEADETAPLVSFRSPDAISLRIVMTLSEADLKFTTECLIEGRPVLDSSASTSTSKG